MVWPTPPATSLVSTAPARSSLPGWRNTNEALGRNWPQPGQKNYVFKELQRTVACAVLIVDVAVNVIGVGEIDELGAGIKVAIIPAIQAHPGVDVRCPLLLLHQIQQHKLPRVQAESLFAQRFIDGTAERHQLRLDPLHLRKRAHAEKHLVQQAAANRFLVLAGGNVHAADQAFVIFQDIKGIADRVAILQRHATGQGVRLKEALDEFESAAVVPMQLIAPMTGLFQKEWLQLAHSRLAEVDNIHGAGFAHVPWRRCHHIRFERFAAKSSGSGPIQIGHIARRSSSAGGKVHARL